MKAVIDDGIFWSITLIKWMVIHGTESGKNADIFFVPESLKSFIHLEDILQYILQSSQLIWKTKTAISVSFLVGLLIFSNISLDEFWDEKYFHPSSVPLMIFFVNGN